LVLAFLLLFLLQQLLLFRVFLLQLLRLLLMLLLYLLFLGLIRLLRKFRVFLLMLLLNSLPFLLLLRAELILLLLVLPVQLGVRGGLNSGPWGSRNLVRMDRRSRSRPIDLRRLRSAVRVYRTFRRAVSRTIGWHGPVGGSVWWPQCVRRHRLRGVSR
jgi:hypothetical protein